MALAIQIHPDSCTSKTCISPYVLKKIPKTHAHTHIYICIIICNMLGGNCDFCYLVVGGTNAEVGDPFFALENDISRY